MKIPFALTYDDVLLVPQYSDIASRSQVVLDSYITPNIKLSIPVIAENMSTVTGEKMAEAMYKSGAMAFYPRFKSPEDQVKEVKGLLNRGVCVIPAVGIKNTEQLRIELLHKIGIRCVTIDVAHGHQKTAIEFVTWIKNKYPMMEIIAGTVATYKGAEDLYLAGADSVRVGVGPGTICTTRQTTGCGVPQITATLECAKAAKKYDKTVITDGGTKYPGDVVKALAAGAHAVAIGSQFAGTDEAPGKVVVKNGNKYKAYNGSTSSAEKNRQLKFYSKDKNKDYLKYVEGIQSWVPYKGSVLDVLDNLEKAMRSGFTYCNAQNLKELHKRAQFIQVSSVSASENGAHGVVSNF